jgi:hypothetical protein
MFISNYEKEEMRISIRTLQAQMVHVMDELKAMKEVRDKLKTRSLILKTPEAPWGFKKNGSPRKRPGRPVAIKTEAQECITPI